MIEPPPADLDVGQLPAPHLVIEQVAGQPGQPGGLVDGVGQPPGVQHRLGRQGLPGSAASLIRLRFGLIFAAKVTSLAQELVGALRVVVKVSLTVWL